ncbi:hypothetical protein PRIC2_004840 [Phytophthora ramorum]
MLGASASSSNLSAGPRKVRLSDLELFQRVQRVTVPNEPVNLQGLSGQRGWKHVRAGVTGGMRMYFRALPAATTTTPFPTQQCQVVIGGEIEARVSELLSLLRAPSESESNALLRSLYGSRFIYSSLVHAVPSSDQGSLLSPPPRGVEFVNGQQLMVRTASFTSTRLPLNPFRQQPSIARAPASESRATSELRASIQEAKNQQCCYIELLSPTSAGIRMVFRSLDAAEVTAGKAPPERVVALHPISGWFTAEPASHSPGTLRITFQAGFPGILPGGCNARIAQGWLLLFAKGICRLEKVLRRRRHQQHAVPRRLWQALLKPFRALGVSDTDGSGGTHHNWHCIACTRAFLPTLSKTWQRCDLCAYRVCVTAPCCSHERVAIYSRYVAPLLVCARCRECIDDRCSGQYGSGNHAASTTGDCRYAGFSLRFPDRENGIEPELELNPTDRQWGSRRSSSGPRKRRAQSDPPPVLSLDFSSSGEDYNLSGAPAPDSLAKN